MSIADQIAGIVARLEYEYSVSESTNKAFREWLNNEGGQDAQFAAMVDQVAQLKTAGATLLRTIYESGIAYDNPEVEAALAIFAGEKK